MNRTLIFGDGDRPITREVSASSPTSVTRLGDFWKFLETKLRSLSKYIATFRAYLKKNNF